ncbi:MAG: 30S ribosomal protein S21 [Candidatus Sungbacteria bacterium]|nr:30S ribosomal protein S21 [Candidatus Sungbacteria bacterium]
MVFVRKKDKETSSAMLRRFSRMVQQSGVLIEARKGNSYKKPMNKRAMKNQALRRIKTRTAREKLAKLGRLKAPAKRR